MFCTRWNTCRLSLIHIFGVKEVTKEKIMAVAEAACAENDTLHNMPFEVTADKVYAAILAADKIGAYYLEK